MWSAGLPGLGGEPRLDEEDAARAHVRRHRGDRSVEALDGPGVSDRAEEADDRVEPPPELERGHVRLVEPHSGEPRACEREHLRVEIEALDGVPAGEQLQVLAGTAAITLSSVRKPPKSPAELESLGKAVVTALK